MLVVSPLTLSSLPLITLNLFHHSIHSLSHSRSQFVKARLQPTQRCMIYQISIMICNSGERRFLSTIHNKLVFLVNENLLMNNVAYLVLVRLTQQLYRERENTKKEQAFVSVIYKGHKSGKYLLKAPRLRKDVHFSQAE